MISCEKDLASVSQPEFHENIGIDQRALIIDT